MHTAHSNQNNDTVSLENIGEIIVNPGEEDKLLLGLYEKNIPQPTFRLELRPDVAYDLKSVLTRVDSKGEYLLIYHFRNSSPKPCHIIVYENCA
jgi:hypothetical protein